MTAGEELQRCIEAMVAMEIVRTTRDRMSVPYRDAAVVLSVLPADWREPGSSPRGELEVLREQVERLSLRVDVLSKDLRELRGRVGSLDDELEVIIRE